MKRISLMVAFAALVFFHLHAQQTLVLPTASEVKQVNEHISYRGELKDIIG